MTVIEMRKGLVGNRPVVSFIEFDAIVIPNLLKVVVAIENFVVDS